MAFVIEPRGPSAPPAAHVQPAPTADYGRYLVHNVGNCVNCHSKIDMRTGALAGPLLGGGGEIPSETNPAKTFITPNLTPDPRWGWIASWPEEVFVARVHMGKQRDDSPMPWHAFKRMNDDDLRAIFRYLRTVPPVAGGPDPTQENAVVVGGGSVSAAGAVTGRRHRTHEIVRHVRSARSRGRGAAGVGAAGACRRRAASSRSRPTRPRPRPRPRSKARRSSTGGSFPSRTTSAWPMPGWTCGSSTSRRATTTRRCTSGSVFVGANASAGDKVAIAATGMLGAVFGDADGVVPGFRITMTWWKLDLSTEDGIVIDPWNVENSFFYSWSELGFSPWTWLRVGLVAQRMRVVRTELDFERGLLAGVSFGKLTATVYELNAGWTTPTWVFALAARF